MREFAKEFYSSRAWKDCREAYYNSKSGLCENCLKQGIYTPAEIIHHIEHITPTNIDNPEITLNFDNLMCVCRKCHGEIHRTRKLRYQVDELGRIINETDKL